MPRHLLNRSARITWEQNDTTREWVPESRRVSFFFVERFLTFIVWFNPYTHRLKYLIPAPFPRKNAIQTVTTCGHETSWFHDDELYEYGLLETETTKLLWYIRSCLPMDCTQCTVHNVLYTVYCALCTVHNVRGVNRRNLKLTFFKHL
jgi:hypothetical protein